MLLGKAETKKSSQGGTFELEVTSVNQKIGARPVSELNCADKKIGCGLSQEVTSSDQKSGGRPTLEVNCTDKNSRSRLAPDVAYTDQGAKRSKRILVR